MRKLFSLMAVAVFGAVSAGSATAFTTIQQPNNGTANVNKLDFKYYTGSSFEWKIYLSTQYTAEAYQHWTGMPEFFNFLTGVGQPVWNQGVLMGNSLDYASNLMGGGRNMRNEFKTWLGYLNPISVYNLLNPKAYPQGEYIYFSAALKGSTSTDQIYMAPQQT